ncbi:MAG: hypothetical protein ACMG6E_05730 [Candidatus Roizmanbacteria bacterium]
MLNSIATKMSFEIPSDRKQLQAFLPLIKDEWFRDHSKWQFIGQCIFNILEDDGFELFQDFTIEQFTPEAQKQWSTYKHTSYGMGSIRCLARLGDSKKFQEYLQRVTGDASIGALRETAGTTELADIAHFMFRDQFVCTDVSRQIWYQFRDSKWQELNGGHILRQRFSRQLAPIFKALFDLFSETITNMDEEGSLDKDDPIIAMQANCKKIVRGLKTPAGKTELMRECSEIFYDEDFANLLDENPMLLGVKNGIYDFNIMNIRPGFPEDYVSFQAGVDYNPDYHQDHPDVIEVKEYFKELLNDDDIIKFCLGHKATCLVGGNLDKWLVMYVGETAHNGKTTLGKLDKHTFGRYFGKVPLGAMVGKTPDVGAANPVMADAQGKRLLQIDEANKKQKINESFLKTGTGNDEYHARKLYSNGRMITPQFTMIMIMNQAPKDLSSDPAIWERIEVLPFDSRYVSNPPESLEEQRAKRTYKANPMIDEKLKRMARPYLWVLIEEYKEYVTNKGLKKPKLVIEKTDQYKKSNDIYGIFITEKLEKSESKLAALLVEDVYIRYKQWFIESYPSTKPANKEEFEEEAKRFLGEPEGAIKKWKGYKMKTTVQKFKTNEG